MPLTPPATATDTPPSSQHPVVALVLACAVLAALAGLGVTVVQQVRMAPSAVQVVGASPDAASDTVRDVRAIGTWSEPSGPAWGTLTAAQKQALTPLQERWGGMAEAQKRRWLVLAQSFASLPDQEQAKLHERMAQWANLSAQQRSQARLNYAITNRLTRSDKRAQWEAYQALSEEEKQRLAAHAAPKPAGAATALRPNPARKLVRVPAATQAAPGAVNLPKIVLPDNLRSRTAPHAASDSFTAPTTPTTHNAMPAAAVETVPVETPSAVGIALPPLPPSIESASPPTPAASEALPVLTPY